MATVVGILDEPSFESNTDILVVADPATRVTRWVPGDLWSDRITGLSARRPRRPRRSAERSGNQCAARRVREPRGHGLRARGSGRRRAGRPSGSSSGIPSLPSARSRREASGSSSSPRPRSLRAGESISGSGPDGADRPRSDLDRIERQKVLLGALLRDGFDFRSVLAPGLPVRVSGPEAVEELPRVRPTWRFETLGGLTPTTIDGMMVLTREDSPAPSSLAPTSAPGRDPRPGGGRR
jgi:hypothetical protein